jgi:hypothetical protein
LKVTALAAAFGCGSSELEQVTEETFPLLDIPEVTLFATVDRDEISDKAFERAEKYIREEIGIPLRVQYVERKEDIPDLDHITKFACIEYDAAQKTADKMRELDNLTNVDENTQKTIEFLRKTFQECNDVTAGEIDSENSLFYLVSTKERKKQYKADRAELIKLATEWNQYNDAYQKRKAKGKINKKTEKILKERKDLISNLLDIRVTNKTRDIVHEFLHLAGLWHTFHFTNDGQTNYVRKEVPNVMSYETVKNFDTPFDLTNDQKRTVRDYFSRGSTFEAMKAAGFSFSTYTDRIGKERGFIKDYTDRVSKHRRKK